VTEPDKPLDQMTAQERLDLGRSYYNEDKFDEAIKALSSIRREEAAPEIYAQALLGIGAAYQALGKLKKAIKAWSKVRHGDDPKAYAGAQLGLGLAYRTQGKLDDAIAAWSNIHRDDNPETYAGAQLNLGVAYEDQGNLDKAKEAYRNAREFFYYEGERGYRIHECPPEVIKKLRNIAKSTDKVLKSLQIIPDFESQVAHYSRASTAFTLLEKKRNNQKPSHFRLSTIRGVNDPTEGLVLGKYWAQQGISETIHTNDTATFISCFTFNHDSLNQFRLYGKEDGQEATGVSLVFKKEFFRDQSDTLEFIAAPSIDPSSNSGQTGSQYEYKVQLTSPIGKLKQGFNVSLEVTKDDDALLVPVTAVTKQGSDNYVWVYDDETQKIKQVKVKLGNADAKQQEIASGLKEGQKVITKADKSFKDGETLKDVTDADSKQSKDTSGEEVKSSD